MKQPQDFAAVMKAAGIPAQDVTWVGTWPGSQASFQLNNLYFFQPRWLEEALAKLAMPEPIREAYRNALPFFAHHPEFQRLAWHCCHLLYETKFNPADFRTWPQQSAMISEAVMFYAFVALAGLPHLERLHGQRGIDPAITYDTLADMRLWIEDYHQKNDRWGLANIGWVFSYLSGKLVKLGRLQFKPSMFPYDFHIYRHRRDSKVLMLAGDGMQFRPDGQLEGANQIMAGAQCWTSRWSATASEIKGHPVSRAGLPQSHPVTLSSADWDEALARKSPILEVHIPATGPLTHAACLQSRQQAKAFFPVHYPEVAFVAFTCVSWLMDNQFDRYLPETSNILQFQRDFHLHPVPGASDAQTYERVFVRSFGSIDEAPQATSLQRTLVAHVKAGGRWQSGGGVILRDGEGI